MRKQFETWESKIQHASLTVNPNSDHYLQQGTLQKYRKQRKKQRMCRDGEKERSWAHPERKKATYTKMCTNVHTGRQISTKTAS